MKKYQWCLAKTYQFIQQKEKNIFLRKSYYDQLVAMENDLFKDKYFINSKAWISNKQVMQLLPVDE